MSDFECDEYMENLLKGDALDEIRYEEDENITSFGIHTICRKRLGTFIRHYVKENTQGKEVDIYQLMIDFGFQVLESDDRWEKGRIQYNGNERLSLFLSKYNTPEENNTICVMLAADFALRYKRGVPNFYSIDVFGLKEIKRIKESKQIYLATRMAIPNDIIAKLDQNTFNLDNYANESSLMRDFIVSVRNNKWVYNSLKHAERFNEY